MYGRKEIRTLKGITRSVSNRDRLSLACALPLRFSVINQHQVKKKVLSVYCIGITIYTRTDGLEPSTKWLKVTYSTNWVMSSKKSSIFLDSFSLIRVRAVKLLLYCPHFHFLKKKKWKNRGKRQVAREQITGLDGFEPPYYTTKKCRVANYSITHRFVKCA